MDSTIKPFTTAEQRILARALRGDRDAVEAAISLDTVVLETHRAMPALAGQLRREGRASGDIPGTWIEAEAGTAARWLMLDATRASVGRALRDAGLRWMPIKGCDVADRFHDTPMSRPTSDLDILVRGADFGTARRALEQIGWHGATSDPIAERYRVEEGYAWPAVGAGRPLLEVHFRLWGFVPEALSEAVLESAVADPAIDGHRPSPADAYLLAALHWCLQPTPRSILEIYDLERIADRVSSRDLVGPVIERLDTFQISLPVALGAAAAHALFGDRQHGEIADAAHQRLRRAERRITGRFARRGIDGFSTADVVLARLLARRPSRAGWRTALRRFWAHPGVVAIETPTAWRWPRRRAAHLLRQLGLGA